MITLRFALALVCCVFVLTKGVVGQGVNSQIIVTEKSARLVELTAIMSVTNQSNAPVSRYVVRVTVPPN
jgi:hypothetical protein